MLILDLWRISFHAVVVFGLGKNHLLKSILGRCDESYNIGFVKKQKIGLPGIVYRISDVIKPVF